MATIDKFYEKTQKKIYVETLKKVLETIDEQKNSCELNGVMSKTAEVLHDAIVKQIPHPAEKTQCIFDENEFLYTCPGCGEMITTTIGLQCINARDLYCKNCGQRVYIDEEDGENEIL